MRRLIVALAAGFVVSAHADMVTSNGTGDELRLMAGPCTVEAILDQIKPEFRDSFKKAQAMINGKTLVACWIDTNEGFYFLHFGDGAMTFPVTMFTNSPGV